MVDELEQVKFNDELLAIIMRANYHSEGINFITPEKTIIQLGYMSHLEGKKIEAHLHNPYKRETYGTQEVLFIKKGRIKVDFFTSKQDFVLSKTLKKNDWLILLSGGHSFEILDDAQMIEVKNGPYAGDQDKIRF